MMNRVFRFAYALSWVALVLVSVKLGITTVNVVRDLVGPNRLIVPMRAEPGSTTQLFFDQGFGIRAEDCANAWVGGGTALNEVVFQVPRQPLRQLRLDPVLTEGKFAVGAPRLESATGTLIAQFPLTAVVALHQVAELQRESDHWVGRTIDGANDPQLTLGLGEPLRVGQPRLPWSQAAVVILLGVVVVALRSHPVNRETAAAAAQWMARVYPDFLRAGGLHGKRSVLAGMFLVGAVQLLQLWPLHRTLDWPLWDEINYAARGAAWIQEGGGLGDLHSAPLYVASYGLLTKLGDLAQAIFVQHYVLKLISTVLLYVVLASWWRSALAAAAVALFWGSTEFQLEFPQLVYHSGWVWFLAAIAVISRWPLLALVLLGAATCVRQEYQLSLAVLVGCIAWRQWRDRAKWWSSLATAGDWKRGTVLALLAMLLLIPVATQTSFSGSGGRAWFAFQQHYAVRAVAEGETQIANPFFEYSKVIERDFPGATSLAQAWSRNPAALAHHVGYNLRNVGTELLSLARPHSRRPMAWLLIVAAVLALISSQRREQTDGLNRRADLSIVAAITGVMVIAPGLFVLAKGAYLLPLVPICIGAAGWGVQKVGTRLGAGLIRGIRIAAACAFAVALTWGLFALRPFVPGERARPIADTALRLMEKWPAAGREVLLGVSASSFAHYIGDDRCEGVEPVGAVSGDSSSAVSLEDWLERMEPLAVLVTDEWRTMNDFRPDEFATVLVAPEWTRQRVAAGDVYWRRRD